jgi:hypothetical protein
MLDQAYDLAQDRKVFKQRGGIPVVDLIFNLACIIEKDLWYPVQVRKQLVQICHSRVNAFRIYRRIAIANIGRGKSPEFFDGLIGELVSPLIISDQRSIWIGIRPFALLASIHPNVCFDSST